MNRILSRRSICVRSELSLLNLILGWAESNISDPEDYIFLARLLNLTYIDRRTVLNRARVCRFFFFETNKKNFKDKKRKKSLKYLVKK